MMRGISAARRLASAAAATSPGAGEALPAHAVRLDDGARRFTLLPLLHGRLHGHGSGEEVAQVVRDRAPRQVFVELCAARYAEVLATAVAGAPPRPPPRADILGNIHSGLLTHELAPVLRAAREVGAAVIPVDRPRAAVRSRVAQVLWHPRLLQGLLRYGAECLRRRDAAVLPSDAEALRAELENSCQPAYKVLVEERCSCMAHQVRSAAVPGADALLVCGAPHIAAMAAALRNPSPPSADEIARMARRSVPIWPIYALGYIGVPAAITGYAVVCAWESFGVAIEGAED